MSATVRAARAQDAAALVPLFAQWEHAQPEPVVAERIAAWAAAPDSELLVAESPPGEGAVAGLVAVAAQLHLARPGRSARIIGLVVDERARRRGVGAALIAAAEELARGWGCDRLELTSSRRRDAAMAFYAALGFEDWCPVSARLVREL
jgi:GNAT superfamily N-acetyltransferase